ncbi:hypothetical protein HDV05_007416 [Chytridiales sp. JEL 0842]|nr:hypothetical protein HDV05_007416 [Chytridiales sp. JEL 0842]
MISSQFAAVEAAAQASQDQPTNTSSDYNTSETTPFLPQSRTSRTKPKRRCCAFFSSQTPRPIQDPDEEEQLERDNELYMEAMRKLHSTSVLNGRGDTVSMLDWDGEPSWRERTAFFLDASTWGRWWEIFDSLLNFMFVGIYITNTSYADGTIPLFNHRLDAAVALVIFLQWLPFLYFSIDPEAALSPLSVVSFLATVPVVAMHIIVREFGWGDVGDVTFLDAGGLVILYPFRFWRLHLSTMRIVKPSKNFIFNFSLLTQKSIALSLSIFNVLLTVSSFVHMVERTQGLTLSFWDVFYWIFVTCSSGLSTKIVPDNMVSRLVVIYVMITGLVFLPPALSELIYLIRKKSKYDHSYKPTLNRDHILLVGDLEISAVRDFLREFFCEDHGSVTMMTRVVLMNPEEPGEELKALLADPLYANRVTYVKGSTLSTRSLQKCQASLSKAVFILSPSLSPRPAHQTDAEAVMRVLGLKKFDRNLKVFAQVQDPLNKEHFQGLVEKVVCLDEFKLGLLAQNTITPGFITLVSVLITSVPETALRNFERVYNEARGGGWVKDYLRGVSMEIYTVILGPGFKGVKFKVAAERLFLKHGIVLFAISPAQTLSTSTTNLCNNPPPKQPPKQPQVRMNPAEYVLRGFEVGYVIAKDVEAAVESTKVASWMFEGGVWDRDWEVPDVDNSALRRRRERNAVAGSVEGSEEFLERGTPPMGGSMGELSNASIPGLPAAAHIPPASSSSNLEQKPLGSMDTSLRPAVDPNVDPLSPLSDDSSDFHMRPGAPRRDLVYMGEAKVRSLDTSKAGGSQECLQEAEDDEDKIDVEMEGAPRVWGVLDGLAESPKVGGPPSGRGLHQEPKTALMSSSVPKSPRPFAFSNIFKPFAKNGSGSGTNFFSGGSPPFKRSLGPRTHPNSPAFTSDPLPPPMAPLDDEEYTHELPLPSELKDHLLICALSKERFPPNLPFLIAPIRQKLPGTQIVVLSPASPHPEELDKLLGYGPNVWVFKGTPLVRSDLKRVGVETAKKAVVLANPTQENVSNPAADAQAILAVLNIEAMSTFGIFINVEFIHPSNMKLLGSGEEYYARLDLYGQNIMPAFVGGHVFSQSMLNTLLVQTFYNPHLLIILKHLTFNYKKLPIATTSNTTYTSHLDTEITEHAQVFRVRVPRKYYGKSYAHLVVRLLRDSGSLALGLYRYEEVKGHEVKYVVVNPPPFSNGPKGVLRSGDYVFVLARKEVVL